MLPFAVIPADTSCTLRRLEVDIVDASFDVGSVFVVAIATAAVVVVDV